MTEQRTTVAINLPKYSSDIGLSEKKHCLEKFSLSWERMCFWLLAYYVYIVYRLDSRVMISNESY